MAGIIDDTVGVSDEDGEDVGDSCDVKRTKTLSYGASVKSAARTTSVSSP